MLERAPTGKQRVVVFEIKGFEDISDLEKPVDILLWRLLRYDSHCSHHGGS